MTRRLSQLGPFLVFWLGMTIGPSPAAQSRATESVPSAIRQVVLLGTGVPGWNPDSSGPATAVVVRDLAVPARKRATTASTIRVRASGLSAPTSAVIRSLLAVNSFPGLA